MNNDNREEYNGEIRPFTTAELIRMYGLNSKSWGKWLTPKHKEAVGERRGQYFNVNQVKYFFGAFGEPPYGPNPKKKGT